MASQLINGESFRRESLLYGGHAYYINGIGTSGPILVHFGLCAVQTAICLCCFTSHDCSGHSVADLASWFYRHYKDNPPGRRLGGHIDGVLPTMAEIKRRILGSLDMPYSQETYSAPMCPTASRPVVLGLGYIQALMSEKWLSIDKREVKCCDICLGEFDPGSKLIPCCASARIIQLTRIKRCKKVGRIYITDDAGILNQQATRVNSLSQTLLRFDATNANSQGIQSTLVVRMPGGSLPHISSTLTTPIAAIRPSTLGRLTTSPTPPSMMSQSTTSPTPQSGSTFAGATLFSPIPMQSLVSTEQSPALIVSQQYKKRIMDSIFAEADDDSKQIKRANTDAEKLLDLLNLERNPTIERMLSLAAMHSLDSTSDWDLMIRNVGVVVESALQKLISKFSDELILLIVLSKLPALAVQGICEGGKSDNDPRVSSLREFSPSKRTRADRASVIAKVLKIISMDSTHPLNAKVVACLSRAREDCLRFRSQHPGSRWDETVKAVDRSALYDASMILSEIATMDDSKTVLRIVQPLVFSFEAVYRSASAGADEIDEVQDDSDDEFEESEPPNQSSSSSSSQVTTTTDRRPRYSGATTIRRFVTGLLSVLKCAVLFQAFAKHSESELTTVGGTERTESMGELVKKLITNTHAMPNLAVIINRLRAIETAHPSLLNNFTPTGEIGDYGEVVVSGDLRLDPSLWVKGFQNAIKSCLKTLLALTGAEETASNLPPWYAPLFDVPDQDSYRITYSENGKFPLLDQSTMVVQNLKLALRAYSMSNLTEFKSKAELMREYIIALIDISETDTLRTPELFQISRGIEAEKDPGNVFATAGCGEGETGLLLMMSAQKTGVTALSFLQPPVAKLLLVFFDLVMPVVVEDMTSEVRSKLPQHLREYCPLLQVHNSIARVLRSRLGVRCELDPKFVHQCGKLNDSSVITVRDTKLDARLDCGSTIEISLLGDDLIRPISAAAMGAIIRKRVCTEAFEEPRLKLGQKRSLMVNFRSGLMRNLDCKAKICEDDGVRHQIDAVKKAHGDTTNHLLHIEGFARLTGNHTPAIQLGNYQYALSLGGGSEGHSKRIPNVLLRQQYLLSKMVGIVLDCPRNGERAANPSTHTLDVICIRNKVKITNVDDALRTKLREVTRHPTADFLSNAQRQLMHEISTHTCSVFGGVACGGGKTLGAIIPHLLLPREGQVLILMCPYRALVEQHRVTLESVDIRCTVFEQNHPQFKPDAFSNGLRSPTAALEIVLATTDASVNNGFREFLLQAGKTGRCVGLILDEAHQLIVSASYRPVMGELARLLSKLHIRLIVLSGTLPEPLRTKLFEDVGLHPKDIRTVIEDSPPNSNRRVIDLVMLSGKSECEIALSKTLTNWMELCKVEDEAIPNKHAALVFCFTKSCLVEYFSYCAKGFGDDDHDISFDILKLDSDDTAEHRKEVLAVLSNPRKRFTIVLATSILAEGADAPSADLVICLDAAHNGILSLVQMAARVGRGRLDSRAKRSKPHFVFFFLPVRTMYMLQTGSQLNDQEALINTFAVESRARAGKLLSVRRQMDLFPIEEPRCGTALLDEIYLGTGSSLPDCSECYGCCRVKRKDHALLKDVRYFDKVPPMEREKWITPSHRPLNSEQSIRINEDWNQTVKRAIDFLRQGDDLKICMICEGRQHHPNECELLKRYLKPDACFNCFNRGHRAREVAELVQSKTEIPARKYAGAKFCAWVVKGSERYSLSKPCSFCLLSHVDNLRVLDCATSARHEVRGLILSVFHVPARFNLFLASLSLPATRVQEMRTWHGFFDWCVYQRGDGAEGNNVYRLISWCAVNPFVKRNTTMEL